MAPAAVDASDLSLRAGEGESLEIWPETVYKKKKTVWDEVKEKNSNRLLTHMRSLFWAGESVYTAVFYINIQQSYMCILSSTNNSLGLHALICIHLGLIPAFLSLDFFFVSLLRVLNKTKKQFAPNSGVNTILNISVC